MIGFFSIARSNHNLAAMWLAAASLFFYGWWNPAFVSLVMASITANYIFGYAIARSRLVSTLQATMILPFAVGVNLAILAYFKYANFFVTSLNQLTTMELAAIDIMLPLGISFFTFTQIAFLADVHRGVAREYNFIHYVLFVTYFPHLIAGPVLHHKQMMPQFGRSETYRISLENINIGLTIFIFGLAKKVLLADQFALYASPVFDVVAQGGEPKVMEAWIGALAYALQIYFDFSGYSDMAIGVSRMFNIRLPLNFDSPYKATNIIDFWRRWHMTLSTFLRDYLYVPLGGSRKGSARRYVNLMATMLLGGLWHGAGWTFVLWGGMHGVYLVINHGWQRYTGKESMPSGWSTVISVGFTFIAVVIAWVPFRVADIDTALRMWAGMFGMNGLSLPSALEPKLSSWPIPFITYEGIAPLAGLGASELILALPFGLAVVWLLPNTQQWMANYQPAWDAVRTTSKPWWQFTRKTGTVAGILLSFSLLMLTRESPFLYFQF